MKGRKGEEKRRFEGESNRGLKNCGGDGERIFLSGGLVAVAVAVVVVRSERFSAEGARRKRREREKSVKRSGGMTLSPTRRSLATFLPFKVIFLPPPPPKPFRPLLHGYRSAISDLTTPPRVNCFTFFLFFFPLLIRNGLILNGSSKHRSFFPFFSFY